MCFHHVNCTDYSHPLNHLSNPTFVNIRIRLIHKIPISSVRRWVIDQAISRESPHSQVNSNSDGSRFLYTSPITIPPPCLLIFEQIPGVPTSALPGNAWGNAITPPGPSPQHIPSAMLATTHSAQPDARRANRTLPSPSAQLLSPRLEWSSVVLLCMVSSRWMSSGWMRWTLAKTRHLEQSRTSSSKHQVDR